MPNIMNDIKVFIYTASDSCFAKTKEDKSGAVLAHLFHHSGFSVKLQKILPDDQSIIESELEQACDSLECPDIIVLTGGTGFTRRDVTPEAVANVIKKSTPGITHALLAGSLVKTDYAMLSRLNSGIRNQTLILSFPGSIKAVKECFDIVLPVLLHAVAQLRQDTPAIEIVHKQLQSSTDVPSKDASSDQKSEKTTKILPKRNVPVCDRPRESPFPMLSIHQTTKIILQQINLEKDVQSTSISINDPLFSGCVVSEEMLIPFDLPPFDASLKDGYAVRSQDGSMHRKLIGYPATAGTFSKTDLILKEGECVRISTGACLPQGCDAIVQVEDTKLLKKTSGGEEIVVKILKNPKPKQDIRFAGSDAPKNDVLLSKGTQCDATYAAICASVGLKEVPVFKKPRIAVISTGNELLDPGQPLEPGKVYDSNSILLHNLLRDKHFDVFMRPKVNDSEQTLRDAIFEALGNSDVLITSGGVSMGEKDLLKTFFTYILGAQIHVGRVNMKPGKPFTFATCKWRGNKKWIFALPGNPVSAYVTTQLFVLPALYRLSGLRLNDDLESQLKDSQSDGGTEWLFKVHRTCIVRVSAFQLLNMGNNCCDDNRPEFVRARIEFGSSVPDAKLVCGNQASSRLLSLVNANILVYFENKVPSLKQAIFI